MDWELDEHQRENGLANLVSDGEAAENRRMDRELDQYLRDNGLAQLFLTRLRRMVRHLRV
jgi:hypothetical protein